MATAFSFKQIACSPSAVSYTHLDVYKRQIQDPIHYVLYCECRSELKVALLTILQDHERWIKDFLATMEEVAVKIAQIMDAHRHIYAYLDQFLHTKEAYDRLLKRIGFPLAEDMPVIASLSACNMANVQGTQRGDQMCIRDRPWRLPTI